jgi:hypothetical protein
MTTASTILPHTDAIPADVDADNQAVIEMLTTGKPLDPETERRIRERAGRIREELLAQFGVREVAAELVRASREEV